MTIKLKRPRWVVSDEGWEFYGYDKEHMVYFEKGVKYLIEIDHGIDSTGVYMHTLMSIDKNITITDEHKEKIKKRVAMAFQMMGVNVEFC